MTREQRNQAKGRLEDLTLRLSALDGILATQLSSPFYRTECDKIREETQAELDLLEKTLATKWEFLFNFKSGGWNSEVAFTREEAIEKAIAHYGQPSEDHKVLNIDVNSFRVSTTGNAAVTNPTFVLKSSPYLIK
jgi:hypothetical protein